jgi:hypothetical protein
MKRIIIALIAMSTFIVGYLPAQADAAYPQECVPQPYISVWGSGSPEGSITVDPTVSTNCAPWNGDPFELDNKVEAAFIQYWVEHEYRVGYTEGWHDGGNVLMRLVGTPEMEGQLLGGIGPNYDLTAATPINPGDSGNIFHRYRLVVYISGYVSGFDAAPFTALDTFDSYFYTDWVDYTVQFTRNPDLDPADDFVSPTREPDNAPVGNLRGN